MWRNRKRYYRISEWGRRDKLDRLNKVGIQFVQVAASSHVAPHAAGSMALVDSFGILLGRETTIPDGEAPKTQASLAVKRVKLVRSRATMTQVAI